MDEQEVTLGKRMSTLDEILANAKAKLHHEVIDIEMREDLTDDQEVNQIIVVFSSICAGVAIQPSPFADIFQRD